LSDGPSFLKECIFIFVRIGFYFTLKESIIAGNQLEKQRGGRFAVFFFEFQNKVVGKRDCSGKIG